MSIVGEEGRIFFFSFPLTKGQMIKTVSVRRYEVSFWFAFVLINSSLVLNCAQKTQFQYKSSLFSFLIFLLPSLSLYLRRSCSEIQNHAGRVLWGVKVAFSCYRAHCGRTSPGRRLTHLLLGVCLLLLKLMLYFCSRLTERPTETKIYSLWIHSDSRSVLILCFASKSLIRINIIVDFVSILAFLLRILSVTTPKLIWHWAVCVWDVTMWVFVNPCCW